MLSILGVAQVAVNSVAEKTHEATQASVWLPDHWPSQSELLQNIQNMTPGVAALLVIAGMIYLVFGYQIFRALVLLNAALVGAYMGAILGSKAGGHAVFGALLGALMAAAVTWPVMKYAVAVMGGVFGAMLGATIWQISGQEPAFAWAGAGMGLILCGLLSFMLFKQCVMAYTSLQGSVMLIFGILGLAYKYPSAATQLSQYMTDQRFLLPMAVFIPTLLGVLYQQHTAPAPTAGKK